MDACVAALRGTKKIDLFESARIDRQASLELTVGTLAQLREEGKFDHIGMSECRAETLRKAHAVSSTDPAVRHWKPLAGVLKGFSDPPDRLGGDRG